MNILNVKIFVKEANHNVEIDVEDVSIHNKMIHARGPLYIHVFTSRNFKLMYLPK
jgi:hypothetical protein